MYKLKTQDLVELYIKAKKFNLEKEFIEMIESELINRGVFSKVF
ncbi:sporulation histidine kinase inhibitor Sda [Bacillus solitudinis]|nr:sporulation histidine kinase inhibitor Sda [Bacillus solitudinis]